jgi:integrase
MIAELDRIAGGEVWPRSGLILSTNGKTSVSGFSRGKSRLDREMVAALVRAAAESKTKPQPLKPWRVHDFRRTFATGMQRLGVRFEVTEAILNHVSGSKAGVAGVYQRHDWKEEKVAALDAWGHHLNGIINKAPDSNVVPLRKAGS